MSATHPSPDTLSPETLGLPVPPHVRRAGDVILTVAAVVGALSLAAALLLALTGVTPLLVQSGSMSPEIPTGSLALARSVDVDRLAVGDVVSVHDAAGTRVTHRIAGIDPAGVLTLKGDANPGVDPATYDVETADRVFVSAPYLGTALSALTGPTGRGIAAGVGLVVLLAILRPRRGAARPARLEGLAVVGTLALVLGVGVGVARAPQGTSAFWTDSVAGTSTITVKPPLLLTLGCSKVGNGVTITISPDPGAGYTWYATIKEVGGAYSSQGSFTPTGTPLSFNFPQSGAAPSFWNGNRTYDVVVTATNAAGAVTYASNTVRARFTQSNDVVCTN